MQWRMGPFRIDVDNACLWQGDKRLTLRPKPFALLMYLVEHAGDLVTKDDLLTTIWPDTAVVDSVLKVSMSELRKVLGETAKKPRFIATVHRRGYRLIAPVEMLEPEGLEGLQGSGSSPSQALKIASSLPGMLVDRDEELTLLHQWLQAAQTGQRQVIFVAGEPGIGKTALVDAFVHPFTQSQEIDVSRGQCIDQYGAGEAYLPLLEALGILLRGSDGEDMAAHLKQQAPSWLLQLPAFVSEAEFDLLQRRASGSTRERMLRELAEFIETLTAERTLVLVLEDLHWSDVSTLDWLAYVARRRQPARLLIVGTYRPVDAVVHGHPVRTVSQDLMLRGDSTELVLDYLSEAGVAAYLSQRLESVSIPPAFSQSLCQRTNGNPLFLRMIVDDLDLQSMLQAGAQGKARWANLSADTLETPQGVQHLIAQ